MFLNTNYSFGFSLTDMDIDKASIIPDQEYCRTSAHTSCGFFWCQLPIWHHQPHNIGLKDILSIICLRVFGNEEGLLTKSYYEVDVDTNNLSSLLFPPYWELFLLSPEKIFHIDWFTPFIAIANFED